MLFMTLEREHQGPNIRPLKELITMPLGLGIFDMADAPLVDVQGVPLSSDRGEQKLHTGIDFEYQACPFADSSSRFPDGAPHEVPMSGLERRRLGENYPGMLATLKAFRDYYINEKRSITGNSPSEALSTYEAREVMMGLVYTPHYLVYRSSNAVGARGELPTDMIVLSNVGSGSLAALSAYIETYEDGANEFYNKIPNVEQMIEEAEIRGRMVGEKTVCVASPDQMKHFLTAIINGPSVKTTKNTLTGLTDRDEIGNILTYGKAMYEGTGAVHIVRMLDAKFALDLGNLMQAEKWNMIEPLMVEYEKELKAAAAELTLDQSKANIALGRNFMVGGITPQVLRTKYHLPSADYIAGLRDHQRKDKLANQQREKSSFTTASERRRKFLR